MTGKELGKITNATFGTYPDRPFLMGLELDFRMGAAGVGTGGKYTVNISPNCRWTKAERQDAIVNMVEFICGVLEDAKVNDVHSLIGKPVEVEIEGNTFKSFRILTEVL